MATNLSQRGTLKRCAEARGCVYEVIAHLSHSDLNTSAIYTQRVERARLAEQAVRRIEMASETQGVPQFQSRGKSAMISAGKITT